MSLSNKSIVLEMITKDFMESKQGSTNFFIRRFSGNGETDKTLGLCRGLIVIYEKWRFMVSEKRRATLHIFRWLNFR